MLCITMDAGDRIRVGEWTITYRGKEAQALTFRFERAGAQPAERTFVPPRRFNLSPEVAVEIQPRHGRRRSGRRARLALDVPPHIQATRLDGDRQPAPRLPCQGEMA